ncbi:uncharacterized protein LOC109612109 [Musca domestica]|uniref:Uncharacterized protein LOC109612109 n=1 Tax=Musca domestica TaxID=7370 RepID=A0A9J7ICJ7_MUSDO|nr:uncharacterized protein LOC109612109 [Musca domestica]
MPTRKIFDLTVNACDLLDVALKTKVLVAYVDNFKKFLNVVPTCPLRKNFNYTLTGYHINDMNLPGYIPQGDYRTNHYLEYKKKPMGLIICWVHIGNVQKTTERSSSKKHRP